MIEFSGSIFGAPALLIRVEPLDSTSGYAKDYSVKVIVRDPLGDHIYQRSFSVPDNTVNIFGILMLVGDALPFEAQLCRNGPWTPSQDKTLLELPSA